ncbi:hypothetical protein D3C73_1497700 [compost metagenome]
MVRSRNSNGRDGFSLDLLAVGFVIADVFGDFPLGQRQARYGPFRNDVDRKILLHDTIDGDVFQVLAVILEIGIKEVGYELLVLGFFHSVPFEVGR